MTDKDYMNSIALLSVLNNLLDYVNEKTALNIEKVYLVVQKDVNRYLKKYELLKFNVNEIDNKKLVSMALKKLKTINNKSLNDIISWLIIILKSKQIYGILQKEGEMKR